MKKGTVILAAVLGVFFLSTSCKSKCNIPETDSVSGVAIEDVIIYPSSGYLTSSMGGDYEIHATDSYAENFELSWDGGQTRQSVNYAQYKILGNPVVVKCDAAVEKNVEIDHANSVVTYTVKVHECNQGCDEKRVLENYVLVPHFPDGYFVNYVVQQ
jgi:hypothetical protein